MHLADEARAPAGSLLLAALGLGLAAEVLFFGLPLGVNLLIAVVLLLAVGWLTRGPGARIDRLDTWIFAAAVVFAALVAIRSGSLTASGTMPRPWQPPFVPS